MRVTIPTLVIATLLGGGLPAVAELGPCKADAQQMPLCGSGKGAARVVHDTISTDKKFALAWRHPDKDPAAVTEDDSDLELLLIRLADGAVLAKADTEYFRNPGQYANRREEYAIWSPDSRMLIRRRRARAAPRGARARARARARALVAWWCSGGVVVWWWCSSSSGGGGGGGSGGGSGGGGGVVVVVSGGGVVVVVVVWWWWWWW